jgi:hypothetical protein
MIAIFGDFCQLSAKQLAFFSKINVMIHFFAKTSSSLSKNAKFFSKNTFKIITSVPDLASSAIFYFGQFFENRSMRPYFWQIFSPVKLY